MLLNGIYEVALGPNYEAIVYEHPTKMWIHTFRIFKSNYVLGYYINRLQS
jgi:hypothetical protein